MKYKIVLATLVAGFFGSHVHAVEVANAGLDYQSAQGIVADTTAPTQAPDGWTYVASTAATGGTEVALTPQQDLGNGGNQGFGIRPRITSLSASLGVAPAGRNTKSLAMGSMAMGEWTAAKPPETWAWSEPIS